MRSIPTKFILINRWAAAVSLLALKVAPRLFAARFIAKVVMPSVAPFLDRMPVAPRR